MDLLGNILDSIRRIRIIVKEHEELGLDLRADQFLKQIMLKARRLHWLGVTICAYCSHYVSSPDRCSVFLAVRSHTDRLIIVSCQAGSVSALVRIRLLLCNSRSLLDDALFPHLGDIDTPSHT